jgi:hypothetical protein
MNAIPRVIPLFQSWETYPNFPRGDALRCAQRLPLAFILPRLWRYGSAFLGTLKTLERDSRVEARQIH